MSKVFCHKCGKEHEDDSKFCTACGTALRRGPAPAPQVMAQAPVPPSSKTVIWVVLAVVGIPLVLSFLGIFAAIAVPKMFNMSAKAKVAEVVPALSSWSKLCEAYVLETGKECSDFSVIGFIPPGTADSLTSTSETTSFSYSAENDMIVATSKVQLADCPAGSTWKAFIVWDSEEKYHFEREVDPANCGNLTPTFLNSDGFHAK